MQVFDGQRRIPGKDKGKPPASGSPSAYAWVLILGLLALALLAVLSLVRPAGPPALLACAAVLFLVPGLLMAALTLGHDRLGVMVLLPVAFAFSSGLFALAALPVLVLHGPLSLYLWLCAGIVLLSLALAAVLALRGAVPEGKPGVDPGNATTVSLRPASARTGLLGDLPLWAVFAALGGVLAWFSTLGTPQPNEDAWVYLAQVREFVTAEGLGGTQPYFGGERGLTRLDLNGWLVEQAAAAKVSGADVLQLGLRYLPPVLVLASLLAFYGLARLLFGGSRGALFAACGYAAYVLATLGLSPGSPGWDFVERATEDKFVARFVFLPVALIFAVLYLRERRWRYLLAFALLCWGVAAVHPLGVALIGISCAGFGLMACLFALARRGTDTEPAWGPVLRALALGSAALSLAVPAAAYLVLTGAGVPSLLEATDPSQTAYRLYTWERQERLLVLGEGSYVMHPSLLLQPVVLAAYVLGAPFLAWRAWKARDVGAQLLLGVLVLSPVLLYVPPVTTFLGGFVGPWTIWRLAWPLELAAFLAAGWVLWAAVEASAEGLGRLPRALGAVAPALLPFLLLALAVAAVLPLARTGAAAARTEGETPQSHTLCSDPVFGWLGGKLDRPSVVLAPDNESSCIPAYAADANVVSVRGLAILNNQEALGRFADGPLEEPRKAREVKDFYGASSVDEDMVKTLRRREVDRILVPLDSPLVAQFDHMPAFRRLEDAPGERYLVYAVDRGRLEAGPIERANGLLNDEKHAEAIEAYAAAPSRGPDDDFLALLGSGRAAAAQEDYVAAVEYLEAAVDLDPESAVARGLLAEARNSDGDPEGARRAYEEALERNPRNVELRLDYGLWLLVHDPEESIRQHREVVRMHPDVPEYRIKLGGALSLLSRPDEADRELAKAVELDPLSPKNHADLGKVYESTGRLREAAEHYERALELDPQNQAYAYGLGKVLALLATENPGDEDLFRRAEETLRRVDELEPYSWEPDNRAAAKISLGDLYASRGRTEDARKAYEEAQRIDPESGAAEKLEGLGGP